MRDDVWGILRLGDVVRVGALPAEASEGSVRLALAGETLYLAAGSLYELDPEQGRLVTLLAQGDAVGGGSASDIRHVSIDGGHVVASDGAATYMRDKAGHWQRRPLAVADVDGLRPDAPVITWGDAAYALSRDGRLGPLRSGVQSAHLPISGRLSMTFLIWWMPATSPSTGGFTSSWRMAGR